MLRTFKPIYFCSFALVLLTLRFVCIVQRIYFGDSCTLKAVGHCGAEPSDALVDMAYFCVLFQVSVSVVQCICCRSVELQVGGTVC